MLSYAWFMNTTTIKSRYLARKARIENYLGPEGMSVVRLIARYPYTLVFTALCFIILATPVPVTAYVR